MKAGVPSLYSEFGSDETKALPEALQNLKRVIYSLKSALILR